MCGVRAPVIVEVDPTADLLARIPAAGEGMQEDALVFQGPPQPLDKDVVQESPPPVHRDADAGVMQPLRPCPGRELATLVGLNIVGAPYRSKASSSASTQN